MAAKRRDPTAVGRRQIESIFRKIFAGKLEFISIQHLKAWYGRNDGAAVVKLETSWPEFLQTQDRKPRTARKLFAVGPATSPRGYAVGRHDQKDDWLY